MTLIFLKTRLGILLLASHVYKWHKLNKDMGLFSTKKSRGISTGWSRPEPDVDCFFFGRQESFAKLPLRKFAEEVLRVNEAACQALWLGV